MRPFITSRVDGCEVMTFVHPLIISCTHSENALLARSRSRTGPTMTHSLLHHSVRPRAQKRPMTEVAYI